MFRWLIDWWTTWVKEAVFIASSVTLRPKKGRKDRCCCLGQSEFRLHPLQAWLRALGYNHSRPPRERTFHLFHLIQCRTGHCGVWEHGRSQGWFKMWDLGQGGGFNCHQLRWENCKTAGLAGECEKPSFGHISLRTCICEQPSQVEEDVLCQWNGEKGTSRVFFYF